MSNLAKAYEDGDIAGMIAALRSGESVMTLDEEARDGLIASLISVFDQSVQSGEKKLSRIAQVSLSSIPMTEIHRVREKFGL